MSNNFFQFKQFTIQQDKCGMKVTTDACLFGAWIAERVRSRESGAGSLKPDADSILDVGTGTGLLSLVVAQKNPGAVIDAFEIDKDAAGQAGENVAASPWRDRINIIHMDAREFVHPKKYDIIISNPPFYEKELKADDIRKNIARHSDSLLLSELLDAIIKHLEPDGRFFLLLPYKRHKETRELLFNKALAAREIKFVRQSASHGYFRIMIEGQVKRLPLSETTIGEISIRDDKDAYTPEFIQLLKDYYLHL